VGVLSVLHSLKLFMVSKTCKTITHLKPIFLIEEVSIGFFTLVTVYCGPVTQNTLKCTQDVFHVDIYDSHELKASKIISNTRKTG
jgi:hypothetical protein